MELLNTEGKRIKHMRPAKYRRLMRDLHLFGVPYESENKKIIIQLHYFSSSSFGEDIFADFWILENNELRHGEQIQSF